MSVLYLSICGIGVLLNTIQLAVLFFQRKTKVPFDLSLINLALADFFTSLLPMIFHLFYLKASFYLTIIGYIYYSSWLTSSFMLGYIAFQRLIAVLYPHKYPILMTRRRCIITMCLMWISSSLFIIPVLIVRGTFYNIIFVHIPVAVGAVIFFSYAMLNYQLLKQRNRSVVNQSWNGHRRILVYSTILTVVFLLSTIPYTISLMRWPIQDKFTYIASHIFISHVIVNPIFYFVVQYLNLKRLCGKVGDNGTAIEDTNRRNLHTLGRTANLGLTVKTET